MKRVAALLLLVSPAALADTPPSPWEIAKDPGLRATWSTHLEVENHLETASELKHKRYPDNLVQRELERAHTTLEDADAAHSKDVRLRFNLGAVLYELHRYLDSTTVLKEALAMAPDHQGAEHSWLTYAFANAYTENSTAERGGYEKYLSTASPSVLFPMSTRLIPMLNLAESEMRLGNLDEAVTQYKNVLTLALEDRSLGAMDTEVLAQWGLVVALDRIGDAYASAKAATLVTQWDPPPLDTGSYGGSSAIMPVVRNQTYIVGDKVYFGPLAYECIRAGTTDVMAPTFLLDVIKDGSAFWKRLQAHKTLILDQTTVFFVPAYERDWYLALGETALAKAATDPRSVLTHWKNTEKLWSDFVTGAKKKGGDRWLAIAEKHLEQAQKARAEAQTRVQPQRSPKQNPGY